MLSLYSRVGLTSIRQSLLKPCLVRGIKTIPQPPGFIVGTVNDAYVPPGPKKFEGSLHWTSERAVAIASEHERIILPFCHIGDGHRIPFSSETISSRLTSLRSASDMRRLIASDWLDVHPPDLPIWQKTSQSPASSRFTVT